MIQETPETTKLIALIASLITEPYYELALRLSETGFNDEQVARCLNLTTEGVAALATGNRPYPRVLRFRSSSDSVQTAQVGDQSNDRLREIEQELAARESRSSGTPVESRDQQGASPASSEDATDKGD
ncbi:hypothetical protein YOLOSWAG_271 [Erwinia phage vB_EamM_Yoloswag]|uniref:Uncharacterized protein n=1 Tax=Erwinia phage vB_EamM_Yoloswag TaxID=1958956 RepID=A0A1S6L3I3_9CAUD|nr:hypothetical protein HOR66_gp271 [Erwinia phage vB_EamM_Yoloswag]AQT28744.1 hypothetical protein YOLOSWAG_271 [Erwinia phage vB_EamM_Yoloswag]